MFAIENCFVYGNEYIDFMESANSVVTFISVNDTNCEQANGTWSISPYWNEETNISFTDGIINSTLHMRPIYMLHSQVQTDWIFSLTGILIGEQFIYEPSDDFVLIELESYFTTIPKKYENLAIKLYSKQNFCVSPVENRTIGGFNYISCECMGFDKLPNITLVLGSAIYSYAPLDYLEVVANGGKQSCIFRAKFGDVKIWKIGFGWLLRQSVVVNGTQLGIMYGVD